MANEFVARNGLISLNNVQITGSLYVSTDITGSLFGTSSQAVSASYATTAQTASYVLNATSASYATSASAINVSMFLPLLDIRQCR